jgi:hypothetical protein
MQSDVQVYPLRSLSIGEIFDRAVTIYVKNFALFTLIVLALLVPLAIVNYFIVPDQSHAWERILSQVQNPAKVPPRTPYQPWQFLAIFVVFGITLLIAPFISNAVAVGVAALYRGERPTFNACFAVTLRRWPAILGTVSIALGIGVGLYVATVLVATIFLVTGFAFVRAFLPAAVVMFVIAALLGIAFIVLLSVLIIVFAQALYSTVIEQLGPATAISTSFRRLFSRREFGKVCLIALAYIALQIGVSTLVATISLLVLFLTKSEIVQLAVVTPVNAAMTSFLTILLAVYYFDIRTRVEGLDLEVDLQRLNASA